MSTHNVNIIEIDRVLEHPTADRLEIVPIGLFQAVVRKGEFKPGDRAVYIEPDYVVPTDRPEFSFLAREGRQKHRLKAIRLRGQLSFGLLIPVPDALQDRPTGDNVMGDLGIERYEPQSKINTSADELEHSRWPHVNSPKFDVESYNKFAHVLQPNEEVIITEKIHGANARYVWHNGAFYMGSRNRWVKPDGDHIWAQAARSCPDIEAWCRQNPDWVLYGEVYGPVQSLKYGLKAPRFAAFAVLTGLYWMSLDWIVEDLRSTDINVAPVLYRGPFNLDVVREVAEKDSVISSVPQLMEGVVITPVVERYHSLIGRVALKYISNRYWEFND